jgi:hypothetical protein
MVRVLTHPFAKARKGATGATCSHDVHAACDITNACGIKVPPSPILAVPWVRGVLPNVEVPPT